MKRVAFLDGLRGFAAVAVVLSHYVLAFAPAIGNIDPQTPHPAWQNFFIHSPLFVFADGYVAVSIFFLISGLVLTYSFEASTKSFWAQTLRRIMRLGLPLAASVIFGAVCYAAFSGWNVLAAAQLGGDAWFASMGPRQVNIGAILLEIATALCLGHAHFSMILPGNLGVRAGLPSLATSFNAPLWTLHLEFYGSMIVLLLVAAERNLSAKTAKIIAWIALGGLIAHPLGLFVIGYFAAKWIRKPGWDAVTGKPGVHAVAVIAIVVGAAMSAHLAPAWFIGDYDRAIWFEKLPMKADGFHFFSQYGAILTFFGILAVPAAQRFFGSRLGRLLGKYSFSLYLVHFPILVTVTAFLVVKLAFLGDAAAITLASALGLLLTAACAYVFERCIDRPATALSRKAGLPGFGQSRVDRRPPAAALSPTKGRLEEPL